MHRMKHVLLSVAFKRHCVAARSAAVDREVPLVLATLDTAKNHVLANKDTQRCVLQHATTVDYRVALVEVTLALPRVSECEPDAVWRNNVVERVLDDGDAVVSQPQFRRPASRSQEIWVPIELLEQHNVSVIYRLVAVRQRIDSGFIQIDAPRLAVRPRVRHTR